MRQLLIIMALGAGLIPGYRAFGAEGMFLPNELPAAALQRSGLKIPVVELAKRARAVVQVARGGSGSFVSPRGLLVTNHHVAYGCLARLNAQPAHKGLLAKGYYAATAKAELACPGYDLLVVDEIKDVTQEVLTGVPAATRKNYVRRFEQLRQAQERLRIACEQSHAQRVCEVSALDGGRQYNLSIYRAVRDVRLVYAPAWSLGKYGGDIDNWMFPRHTADFTFLRAYVAKDGRSAAYSESNVPLATPTHLAIGPWGVKKGSLVVVMGFPGRTRRHVSSHAIRYQQQEVMPQTQALLDDLSKVVAERRSANADAKRKYAALWSRLQNSLKYYQMSGEGFKRWRPLEKKLTQEASLRKGKTWTREADRLFEEIGAVYGGAKKYAQKYMALYWLRRVVPSVSTAYDIARWSREKSLPDAKRPDDRYKDKNVYRFIEASKRLEAESEGSTERALLAFFVKRANQLRGPAHVASVRWLLGWSGRELKSLARKAKANKQTLEAAYQSAYGLPYQKDAVARAVDMLYGATRLIARQPAQLASARAYRDAALTMNRTKLQKLRDPLLDFALRLDGELERLRKGPYRLVEKYLDSALHPRWVEKLGATYSDANFTLRLSYGSVQDYHESATGKTHPYMTRLQGAIVKHTGKSPFNLPQWVRNISPAKRASSRFADRALGDIPLNFTCTLDTTGGNSGSAVLDDHGRLVGLLFDGTPESILSDWQYLAKEQRSIVMDLRFALFLAAEQKASALLKELGL